MKIFDNIFRISNDDKVGISGLNQELDCIYIYNSFLHDNDGILVVTNSMYEANILFSSLRKYTDRVLFFPMDDFITSEAIAISPEFKSERVHTLNKLCRDSRYIVVTNLMGVLRYLPDKEVWKNNVVTLKKGQNISREFLVNRLFNIGYEKESIVNETGKIGVRGFVLDVFPIDQEKPIRIEFWDDIIDSIKYFDLDSQLSSDEINEINIYPFTEFLLESENDSAIRKQKYLKFYSKKISGLWEYLNCNRCFYYDYNQIEEGYRLLKDSIYNYSSSSKSESDIKTNYMFYLEDLKFNINNYIMNLDNIITSINLNKMIEFSSYNIDNYNDNVSGLICDLKKYILEKKTIILCCENEHSIKRILKYLSELYIIKTSEDNILSEKINIINKEIDTGFLFENLVVISSNDLFKNNNNKKVYNNKFKMGTKIKNINSISQGDYIVHEAHGIGIYDKLCTIEKNGYKKDYIRLVYDGGDSLYIPVEKIDRISKFSDRDGVSVKLDSLSSDKWAKRKAKVKGKLEEIAQNLLKVSAEREAMKGFAFSEDDENQVLFDSEFEYEETSDQLKAINAIKIEMEKPKPMDMLLCGDVGFGKTEVAFRAIFKAVNDGKQVVYLCPTTILSSQQYNNALKRFSSFPIKIALLNRFVDRKKQVEILNDLSAGKIDILFGTHRVLSNDVNFKNLGLLVVDEEQRFGVTHKEKIKQFKSNVDVLTLSATPIPRTLQMSMSGVRSLSLIETAPSQRLPVQTYVLGENSGIVKDAIYKELSRNGQCFILYNYVDKIEDKVEKIRKLVPHARIRYAHGRMTKNELENIMQDFVDYKFDVLLCTTIIETGIDIPNVNTLIIFDADRFGLSQLYQIRGRIGRSDKIGYAYLMYDSHKMLNDVAIKRLNTIKEFTELGSGFKIAMRDLSIRGAGDILGSEQSGFIDTIGIELYLKLLKDAVDKIKGVYVEEKEDESLDNGTLIDVETHIKDEYIKDEELKIEIHKLINTVDSYKKLNEVKSEIENRFGKVSYEMEIYMYEEWFEKLARKLEIKRATQNKVMIDLEVSENVSKIINGEQLFMLCYEVSKNFKLYYKDSKIHIMLSLVNLDKHFLLYLNELLERLIQTLNL